MAAYRFESNWQATRERRITLVSRARAGSDTAYTELKEMTRRAMLFSIYAVQNPVERQEAFYANAIAGRNILDGITNLDGTPLKGTLGIHLRAVASVDAWMREYFSLALFTDLSGHTFAQAAIHCYGLKWAKAMYAAGCLAFDDAGCIDTHMARMHGIDVLKIASRKGYFLAYARTGWRHTLDQWRDFLIVGAFAINQHDVWFRSILPSAQTA